MYKIAITPHWEVARAGSEPFDTAVLLRLLLAIDSFGSIAQAAKAVGLSYRYAWGLLREAEQVFGSALLATGRGRGTALTPVAEKLIWADRRIEARLSPLLDSLASELQNELKRTLTGPASALRLDASHGFAVAALLGHLHAADIAVELRYRNSSDALAALAHNECDFAGFHVPLGEFEEAAVAHYLRWLNPATHCLMLLAERNIGLFVERGNPKGIRGLADLARRDVQFVNRQAGSGTRMMLELMLKKLGIAPAAISGFDSAELTHSAVAAFIASGMGDVGIGVETAARHFGLDFILLSPERYFFALPQAALETPLVAQVTHLLQSRAVRADIDALAGYDSTGTGGILTLQEAFGTPQKARIRPAR
ncbi:MAG TPA: substrate-binding domain-containing protein [Burkholderiaceae bacterium]